MLGVAHPRIPRWYAPTSNQPTSSAMINSTFGLPAAIIIYLSPASVSGQPTEHVESSERPLPLGPRDVSTLSGPNFQSSCPLLAARRHNSGDLLSGAPRLTHLG